jgi:hypothetical protein
MDAVTPGYSMLTYNNGTNSWDGVVSTTGAISANSNYMLYIRGDRSVSANPGSIAATSTILRTRGTLSQGDQAAITVPGTNFTALGNPYASTIDFEQIRSSSGLNNVNAKFWVWDPAFNLLGGYVLLDHGTGTPYFPVPSSTNYTVATSLIQSGQAFFVQAASGAGGSITIKESDKASGSSTIGFTPTTTTEEMRVTLKRVNTDLSITTADGTLATYNASGSTAVDNADAGKPNNISENFSFVRNNINLMLENRPFIGLRDTSFFNMWNMKVANYQLVFSPGGLSGHIGLTARLEDNFLNTSTPVDLNNSTMILFAVTNDPGSSNNRFRLVYGPQVVLPVTFTSIKATQQSNDIAVDWKVENQLNIAGYEVEKSTDGRNFTKVAAQKASGANGSSAMYNWLDINAVPGDNFYRIKSIGISGDIKYSIIVKVKIGKGSPEITVYPNPVTGGVVTLQFANMPKGNYTVRLINGIGQTIQTNQITHSGANTAQSFTIERGVAKGNYQLQIIKPSGDKEVMKVVIAE